MSFFKSLFKRKETFKEDEAFTQLFKDAFSRYMSDPELHIVLDYKLDNGTPVPPNVYIAEAYEKCKSIESIWDKRGTIYEALDEKIFDALQPWQILERYYIDRYPQRGLHFANEYAQESDYEDHQFLTALSHCHTAMIDYENAKMYAEKALEIKPDYLPAKIAFADVIHLTNNHHIAHELYEGYLKHGKLKSLDQNEIDLIEIIGFHGQILHSSVYAVGLLQGYNNAELWLEIAKEFYHCPYFRLQHSYWLIDQGESLKGTVKMISLTQEFPWFEEAVIQAKSFIEQYQEQLQSTTIMSEHLTEINKIIEERNY